MKKQRAQILTSSGLRNFISGGGRLRFKPIEGERGTIWWEMYGVFEDGAELPVYDIRYGTPRVVKTVRGLVQTARLYHPDLTEITVPVFPDGRGKV